MRLFEVLVDIVTARNFVVCFSAWLIAQTSKVVWDRIKAGKWHWSLLGATGGMPSAHMTLVSCFSSLMGMQHGWQSPVFQASLVLTLVVMNDAYGLRRAAGRQASVLNRVVRDLYQRVHLRPPPLKELLGHTPLEVLAGAVLGCTMAGLFGN